jgi:cobalt-zinc-cadmium efflux system outer membrane protein
VLTRDEAVALALRNNRALRADLELIGQADAELVQAGLMQNPVISFMLMLPDGGGRAMLRGSLPMQPLQDLWLIPARRQVAAAQLQEAVLRVADRAIETATTVRTTYARLQYTQRALTLIDENIQLAEQTTQIIEARQMAGQATQVESNLARIRALRLRSELEAMDAEHRAQQRELLLLIGFPALPDGWRVEPVNEVADTLPLIGDEEGLLVLGAEQRLDLLAAHWSLQAAEQRVALMRREGLPDLALGFTFERAAAPRAPRGPTLPARFGNATAQSLVNRAFGQNMPMPPEVAPWQPKMREAKWTLGPALDLEIPLFDQNQAQVAKAMHESNQRLAEYDDRAQTAIRGIRQALVRCGQARRQVELYRGTILLEVQRNLDLARQTFIAGQEGLAVLLQAQEDVIMTRMKTLEFLRDLLVSWAELEREVGGRLTDTPPESPAAADTRVPG